MINVILGLKNTPTVDGVKYVKSCVKFNIKMTPKEM